MASFPARSLGVPMRKNIKLARLQSVALVTVVATIFGSQGATYGLAPLLSKTSATVTQPAAAHLSALPTSIKPKAANIFSMGMPGMSPLDPYTPTTATPDYFGTVDPVSGYPVGNFANSPLPTSVLIQGPGSGAMYIAEYYPMSDKTGHAGQIEKFDMVNPGYGYDVTTFISVIGGGGVGGRGGNLTFDSAGGITSIAVVNPGNAYGSANGIRKFVQDLPDLAVATPTQTAAVKTFGNPNFIPASESYEIAALRTKWQFSPDLGMTDVNLYAQVDTTHTGTNCPTNELNWRYPDGSFIVNGGGQLVCFIQTNFSSTRALAPFSYLGPTIVANQGVPVRVTFDNYLPSGNMACTVAGGTILQNVTTNVNKCGGDLFLPVDPSTMGAGEGPNGGFFSTNRATIHMHGGVTPWISDGTNDQWVSPASSQEQYPAGVSTRYVPDMWYTKSGTSIDSCYGYIYCYTSTTAIGVYQGGDTKTIPTGFKLATSSDSNYPSTNPGNGRMTFYYTNQQTARLMFYHDHSDGITRLNVYAGLVAGFLLHDTQEGKVMVAAGVRDAGAPNTVNAAQEKVLVIQDKTFVAAPSQLQLQDPTWNTAAWGGYGNMWFPHVYEPNQNPALNPSNSSSPGALPTGRWDYGPWFWPAVTTNMFGPVSNPLYTGPCGPGVSSCENALNPGTPNVTATPEAFNDSMTVNGVSYPVMHAAPKVYRLQILNGSDDRSLSLSIYYAKSDPSNPNANHCTGALWTNPTTDKIPNCGDAGEVSMVPAIPNTPGTQGLVFPDQLQNHFGGMVPDMRTAGPPIVELSSEGGVLPEASVFPANPIGFQFNNQMITVTNVLEHALVLGPAQRADILVDLTNVPVGSTLILYNDAPAPFPGWDPRFDYFTGMPDQTGSGGAPTVIPGYAPNTRTIMQIKVDQTTSTPATSIFDSNGDVIAGLTDAIHADYKASQDAPVVAQIGYDAALGTTTPFDTYPISGDVSAQVTSTGVASILVNQSTLLSGHGTPRVLIGDQISATTLESLGGNGNGARGVVSRAPSDGIGSVTPPITTYTTAPTVTGITPAPTGNGARTAVIKSSIVGSNNLTGATVATNSGYTSTPNVTVTGAASVPAIATAVLNPVGIASFSIAAGGIFTRTPLVTITGPTSTVHTQTAVAVLAPSPLAAVNVVNGGLYTSAPSLTIGGGISPADATAYLSTSVAALTVTNPGVCTITGAFNAGSSYFQIGFTGGGAGGGAPSTVATAVGNSYVNGNRITLRSISIIFGGGGYSSPPTVSIQPVGMSCTTTPLALARLKPGPVVGVTLNPLQLGSFNSDPTISVSGSGGATFATVLQPTPVASITLTGQTVADFTGTPTVKFDIPNAATVLVNLVPTSVASITIQSGTGLGYTSIPTYTIDAPSSAGGVTATATAVMGGTGLLTFTVLDPGAGYGAGPYTVQLSDSTTATALTGAGQISITVTNPGTGYLTAPTVELLYPDGTTDTTSATATLSSQLVNLAFHATGIQELFDLDYGRMNAIMSSEVPFTNFNNQTTLPWSSVDAPTEIINTNLPDQLIANGGQPVDALPDGTQIWRFTHNGVDTHYIHFHMFNVQVLAILGWDGTNQPLPAYDLGWRDTVQMDQLTTVYIAIKPIVPMVPWQLPNSIRPSNPQTTMFEANGTSPITTQDPMMSAFDPTNAGVTATNALVNFGWEYMFHCHILGHEEGDMMRPIPVGVVMTAPTAVTTQFVAATLTVGAHVDVSFVDNSINESGFILQRRVSANDPWVKVAAANRPAPTWDNINQLIIDPGLTTGSTTETETLTDSVPLTDTTTFATGMSYQYRVLAVDVIGRTGLGAFPSDTVQSDPSNLVYVKI